jgi:hypothetical protein
MSDQSLRSLTRNEMAMVNKAGQVKYGLWLPVVCWRRNEEQKQDYGDESRASHLDWHFASW